MSASSHSRSSDRFVPLLPASFSPFLAFVSLLYHNSWGDGHLARRPSAPPSSKLQAQSSKHSITSCQRSIGLSASAPTRNTVKPATLKPSNFQTLKLSNSQTLKLSNSQTLAPAPFVSPTFALCYSSEASFHVRLRSHRPEHRPYRMGPSLFGCWRGGSRSCCSCSTRRCCHCDTHSANSWHRCSNCRHDR